MTQLITRTGKGALNAPLFSRLTGILLLLLSGFVSAEQAILRYDSLHHPVIGYEGMVASQREIASRVGADIMARGGNAVDAAVGVGFALAVVLPRAGNLGGGGFMVIHLAESGQTLAIDFRERAPAAATADMFLDENGNVDRDAYRSSHKSVGVPGSVAGLLHALENYGTLPLGDVIAPAIALAEDGILVDYDLAAAIASSERLLSRHPLTRETFFTDGAPRYQAGDIFAQPALAATLRRIARNGREGFYAGKTAADIVAEMERGGGLITLADLAAYQPAERAVIRGQFGAFEIASMPPPSSGGVHLVQMLNILSHFPLTEYGPGSADYLHLLAETMKLAYADRSKHLGDPDFYEVPVNWLTSSEYAATLAAGINMDKARPSEDIAPGVAPPFESDNTTHFSVMDRFGNAVATTYTLNFSFGSGIMVPGSGFLLNNEMTDFSAKAGVPDGFGLLTGKANAVEANKRPLSAMTPTIVFRDGKPVLVTGSPGGSRIITAVLQHILNYTVFDMNVAAANHAPRIHHQWFPAQLNVEPGFSPDTLNILKARGHAVMPSGTMGSIQAISTDGQRFLGTADPRRPGAGAVPVSVMQVNP